MAVDPQRVAQIQAILKQKQQAQPTPSEGSPQVDPARVAQIRQLIQQRSQGAPLQSSVSALGQNPNLTVLNPQDSNVHPTPVFAPDPEGTGFVKSSLRSLVKPIAWAGTRLGQAIASPINPSAGEQNFTTHFPVLGDITINAPQKLRQEAGAAATVPALALRNPVAGAVMYGAGDAFSEDKSAGQAALRGGLYGLTAKGFGIGTNLLGKGIGYLGETLGKALPEGAGSAFGKAASKISEPISKAFSTVQPAIDKYNGVINNTEVLPHAARVGVDAMDHNLAAVADLPDRALKATAQGLEKMNLRMTPAEKTKLRGKVDEVAKFNLENNVVGTKDMRLNKIEAINDNMENTYQQFLEKDAGHLTESRDALIARLQDLKGKYSGERDALAIDKQIDGAITTLKAKHGAEISMPALNKLKRTTYSNAYNQAGDKVLDTVEHDIGDIFRKTIESKTTGLTVDGLPVADFNKRYGVAITSRKMLTKALGRNDLGLGGRIVAGALGAHFGGPIGFALSEAGAHVVAGTPSRSVGAALLNAAAKDAPTTFTRMPVRPNIGLSTKDVSGPKYVLKYMDNGKQRILKDLTKADASDWTAYLQDKGLKWELLQK